MRSQNDSPANGHRQRPGVVPRGDRLTNIKRELNRCAAIGNCPARKYDCCVMPPHHDYVGRKHEYCRFRQSKSGKPLTRARTWKNHRVFDKICLIPVFLLGFGTITNYDSVPNRTQQYVTSVIKYAFTRVRQSDQINTGAYPGWG